MTDTTTELHKNNSVIEEPAMVMGFLPTHLHDKLRRMAAAQGCSQNALVSKFVREALTKRRGRVPREVQ